MVSDSEAQRRQAELDEDNEKKEQQQEQMAEAMLRKVLTDAYKNIAAGQKNISTADATTSDSFMQLLERGVTLNATADASQQPAANPPGTDPDSGQVPQLGQGPGPVGPGGPQAPSPAP